MLRDPAAPTATAVSENAATSATQPPSRRRNEPTVAWAPGTHGDATTLRPTREVDGSLRPPGVHSPPPPAGAHPARVPPAASRVGFHLHRAVNGNGRVARHSLSPAGHSKRVVGLADWLLRVTDSRSDSKQPSESQQLDRQVRARLRPQGGRRGHGQTRHGGSGARDHLRAGAAEGGAGEEARRREGGAPAPALHAAVVRRRQRRGDAEDPGGGGGGERRCGLAGRRLCRLPVLRVAGRLHRELPQEPRFRDHLRPPRHVGVRGGGGGGADHGELAVQEAGRDGDRGGGGGVRGRGGLRRGVRVGIQRAQQDRPDVHAGMQRLRRLPHRQHRRGALLRGPAPGLVRRHISIYTAHIYISKY